MPYPYLTNDLHVSIATSFHQSFLWLHPINVLEVCSLCPKFSQSRLTAFPVWEARWA